MVGGDVSKGSASAWSIVYLRRLFDRIDHVCEPRTSPNMGSCIRPRPGVRDRNDIMPPDDGKITPPIAKRSKTRARKPKADRRVILFDESMSGKDNNAVSVFITVFSRWPRKTGSVGSVRPPQSGAPERVVLGNYKAYDCGKRPLWLKAVYRLHD